MNYELQTLVVPQTTSAHVTQFLSLLYASDVSFEALVVFLHFECTPTGSTCLQNGLDCKAATHPDS